MIYHLNIDHPVISNRFVIVGDTVPCKDNYRLEKEIVEFERH